MEDIVPGLKRLRPFCKRRFVPENAPLLTKPAITALFQALYDRLIANGQDLRQWLLDLSELAAALDQEGSILYIRMTCQTDHPEHSQAYKNFIEEIVPLVKEQEDLLNQKFLLLVTQFPLDKQFDLYLRGIKTDVELHRSENIPLMTEVQLLSQEYQTICGAMTVVFDGEEMTLAQMGKFLLEPDRVLREKAWRAIVERQYGEHERLDELFDKLLLLRNRIAAQAGCRDFIEYQFKSYHRFDYTRVECFQYHQAVKDFVLPVWRKIMARRCQQMKQNQLRPWDTKVDPLNRPALKPFTTVDELVGGVGRIMKEISKDFGDRFDRLAKLDLLDLASRKGKAPGGYQNTLAEARLPFIFTNAVGVDQDVRTLLHEAGHAFHALYSAEQIIHAYRHAPMEFCEVASMSTELLGNDHLGAFYSKEDCLRSVTDHLEDVVEILIWVAIVDSFQFWIYTHSGHTALERRQAWVNIHKQFSDECMDWEGFESYRQYLWHRQLHIFEVPFYYIEYGIAQLGALQIWLHATENKEGSLKKFCQALSLGGSRPLPELFSTAGLNFDFSAKTIKPLMLAVEKALGI